MLDLALSLPIAVPAAVPGSAGIVSAPAATGTAPDGFARALADASADATAAPDRQELAAPGKIVLAALPGGGLVNGFGAAEVARPTADPATPLIADAPEGDAPDGDTIARDADPLDRDALDPSPSTAPSVVLALAVAPPIPLLPIAPDAVAAAPSTGVSTPAPVIAAPATPLVVPTAPEAAQPAPPSPDIASQPQAVRRLSFKLDPSIEVIDAGTPTVRAPATLVAELRPALRLVTPDLPPAVPLSVKPDSVVASGTPQPAAHAFARAIALAQSKPLRIETPLDVTDITTAAQAIAVGDARPVVLAPRALDTTRDDWPQRLIDRVEAARDAANAGDTRIRLVPEALGKIDIALRQDCDTLHIRFTADQAATRDLLHQAQPRLAELAEARGLRLGQTGVDGGALHQGGDQPRRPVATVPVANRPATAMTAETTSASDDRIA